MASSLLNERHPYGIEYISVSELKTHLGEKWHICRNTSANRERYGTCITRKQYEAACLQALNARDHLRPADKVIADLIVTIRRIEGGGYRTTKEEFSSVQAARRLLELSRAEVIAAITKDHTSS